MTFPGCLFLLDHFSPIQLSFTGLIYDSSNFFQLFFPDVQKWNCVRQSMLYCFFSRSRTSERYPTDRWLLIGHQSSITNPWFVGSFVLSSFSDVHLSSSFFPHPSLGTWSIIALGFCCSIQHWYPSLFSFCLTVFRGTRDTIAFNRLLKSRSLKCLVRDCPSISLFQSIYLSWLF